MRPAPGLDHVVAGQDIAPIITSDVRPTSSVVSMILRGSFCCLYPFNGSLVENRIWACTTNLEAPDGPVNWRSPRRDAPRWGHPLPRGQAPYSSSTTMFAFFDGAYVASYAESCCSRTLLPEC